MMMQAPPDPGGFPTRVDELLADLALVGLGRVEHQELGRLLQVEPDVDPERFERTAAVLTIAELGAIEPMPEPVRADLERQARAWMAARAGLPLVPAPAVPSPSRPAPAPRHWVGHLGWIAAAACLLLAFVLSRSMTPESNPSVESRLETLLASATDVTTLPLAANDLGVAGDVVWSNERQEGFIRLRGLAVNDPSAMQYQLWIADKDRVGHEADRVDGGVFDFPEGEEEIVVPIEPRLAVGDPSFFAVTQEPPGGVIVSDLSGLILTAPVG